MKGRCANCATLGSETASSPFYRTNTLSVTAATPDTSASGGKRDCLSPLTVSGTRTSCEEMKPAWKQTMRRNPFIIISRLRQPVKPAQPPSLARFSLVLSSVVSLDHLRWKLTFLCFLLLWMYQAPGRVQELLQYAELLLG